ncbi:cidABC operon transcriptional activator CidR [Bacillus sp. mrc49]|uniref:cidABC operon transcriptional activator CidR n=1 Tax=Bacillus sp. mrc49 TaxID=2054913 RepID=UPI000C27970A|nr:LysR family transcriptional regulator [Bacillus sp. mrc49]PJN91525.1 LysR family transcriptional regulator [Bacillus sp. mrc49]
MDIKHLQYFIEVTNFNNFTRAADHLFITQPAISKMIKNLENELGVELFDRSRKQLILTDAGKVVLEQAKLIDKAFRNLETEVDNLLGLKKGHIRIGLPPIIDASFFPQILSRFHEQYPNITFQLVEDGSKKIEESVQKDQIDIGVIVLPTNTSLFHHFSFLEEDINLIVYPSHPFANREEIDLAELENESFILFNKDYVLRDLIISSCSEAGFSPHIVTESSRWDFIEEMVYCKLGVALLPESLCRHDERVRSIKVNQPSISWKLGFIWSKDHYLSYAAKEWLKYTKEALNNKE